MRIAAALVATLVLFAIAAPLLASEEADRLIQRGDRYYGNRAKGVKWCVKALECYEKALAVDAESVEASWKFARASYFHGTHVETDEEKLVIFKKGIDLAKRAISIDDTSVASHFWLGVSFGKYGEAKGVMNSLGLVDPIKKEMARVIELDETYEGGGAHRVLGRLYFKLPGMAGGDNDKSLEHLRKAVEIGPARLLNHLFLVETLLGVDDEENARKHLQLIIDAPFEEDRVPENEEEKALAAEMLAELG